MGVLGIYRNWLTVARIARERGVPRAHIALAWLLSKSAITAPIIGATKSEHMTTVVNAVDPILPAGIGLTHWVGLP